MNIQIFQILLLAVPLHASGVVVLTDNIGGAIPDGSTTGLSRSLVLNQPGQTIVSTTIDLGISSPLGSAFLGDLYIFITDGTNLVSLMNRPGKSALLPDGYDDIVDLFVTFSDSSAIDFHHYRTADGNSEFDPLVGTLTGSFQPDGRTEDPALVTSTSPRLTSLSDFSGLEADRTFTLFVADLSSGATHRLDSWSMNVEVVPEPSSGLMMLSGAVAILFRRRRSTVPVH